MPERESRGKAQTPPIKHGITYSLRTLHENFEMSTARFVAIKPFVS